MRRCTKCKTDKPSEEFNKHKSGPGGLSYWCRTCVQTGVNAYRARKRAERLGGAR